MRPPETANWVRSGLLALPLYGALTFWSSLDTQPDPNTHYEAWSRYVTTDYYVLTHLLGSILGLILAIFDTFALGAYLTRSRAGRMGLVAMVTTVFGSGASARGFDPLLYLSLAGLVQHGGDGLLDPYGHLPSLAPCYSVAHHLNVETYIAGATGGDPQSVTPQISDHRRRRLVLLRVNYRLSDDSELPTTCSTVCPF